MLRYLLTLCCLVVLLCVPCIGHYNEHQSQIPDDQKTTMVDKVISLLKPNIPVQPAAIVAPSTPCAVLSYALVNYFVPSNDYVAIALSNPVNLDSSATCPASSLNIVTISLQVPPSNPVYVWLQTAATSGTATTPVYVTGASTTITKGGGSNWFTAPVGTTTMNYVCISGIYSNSTGSTPPPAGSYYYPVSCTILYQ